MFAVSRKRARRAEAGKACAHDDHVGFLWKVSLVW